MLQPSCKPVSHTRQSCCEKNSDWRTSKTLNAYAMSALLFNMACLSKCRMKRAGAGAQILSACALLDLPDTHLKTHRYRHQHTQSGTMHSTHIHVTVQVVDTHDCRPCETSVHTHVQQPTHLTCVAVSFVSRRCSSCGPGSPDMRCCVVGCCVSAPLQQLQLGPLT